MLYRKPKMSDTTVASATRQPSYQDLLEKLDDMEQLLEVASQKVDTILNRVEHLNTYEDELRSTRLELQRKNKFIEDLVMHLINAPKQEVKEQPKLSPAIEAYINRKSENKPINLPG